MKLHQIAVLIAIEISVYMIGAWVVGDPDVRNWTSHRQVALTWAMCIALFHTLWFFDVIYTVPPQPKSNGR